MSKTLLVIWIKFQTFTNLPESTQNKLIEIVIISWYTCNKKYTKQNTLLLAHHLWPKFKWTLESHYKFTYIKSEKLKDLR